MDTAASDVAALVVGAGNLRRDHMDLDSPQLNVTVARRILYRAGLDPNDMAGQVTIRADDGRHYWTSPMETFDVTVPGVVEPYNNRSIMFYGDQAFYDDDGTATDSKERIVAALGRVHVLIMRNHGAVVVGESIEMATARAVLLEEAARFQVRAQSVGGTPFPDNPALAARRAAHVGNLGRLWDSHVRRLMRTDPELFETRNVTSSASHQ